MIKYYFHLTYYFTYDKELKTHFLPQFSSKIV